MNLASLYGLRGEYSGVCGLGARSECIETYLDSERGFRLGRPASRGRHPLARCLSRAREASAAPGKAILDAAAHREAALRRLQRLAERAEAEATEVRALKAEGLGVEVQSELVDALLHCRGVSLELVEAFDRWRISGSRGGAGAREVSLFVGFHPIFGSKSWNHGFQMVLRVFAADAQLPWRAQQFRAPRDARHKGGAKIRTWSGPNALKRLVRWLSRSCPAVLCGPQWPWGRCWTMRSPSWRRPRRASTAWAADGASRRCRWKTRREKRIA